MKNLLDESDRQQVISRINALTADRRGLWGTMDVAQMLTHCQRPLELALTSPKPPRNLLGYIMGPLAKEGVFGPKPFKQNGYTPPPFKVTDPQEFQSSRERLLHLIGRFPKEMPTAGLVHPFFGAMPLQRWGEGMYKHLDYHLGQFGA